MKNQNFHEHNHNPQRVNNQLPAALIQRGGGDDKSSYFHLSGSNQTLLHNIQPKADVLEAINNAVKNIREEISKKLPLELAKNCAGEAIVPKPRFKGQGSGVCGLLNDPLRSSQNYSEADFDLGIYQPLTALKSVHDQPNFAAEIYLDAVELSLAGLVAKNGWITKRKSCCIRVKIRHDAHIDVTCYVLPDEEFRSMLAKAMTLDSVSFAQEMLLESVEQELTWEELPEQSLLATKDGWQRSDAKAIQNTVENASKLYGSMFKRVIRYIKDARDFNDDPQGPCSIAITLILAKNFSNIEVRNREDLTTLNALGAVANGLFSVLPTPGNEDIDILANMSNETREKLAYWLRKIQAMMHSSIYIQNNEHANLTLREIFGTRFPMYIAPIQKQQVQSSHHISRSSSITALAPAGNVRSA